MRRRSSGLEVLVFDDGTGRMECDLSSLVCKGCTEEIQTVPGVLVYSPDKNNFDCLCRECSLEFFRTAAAELNSVGDW